MRSVLLPVFQFGLGVWLLIKSDGFHFSLHWGRLGALIPSDETKSEDLQMPRSVQRVHQAGSPQLASYSTGH